MVPINNKRGVMAKMPSATVVTIIVIIIAMTATQSMMPINSTAETTVIETTASFETTVAKASPTATPKPTQPVKVELRTRPGYVPTPTPELSAEFTEETLVNGPRKKHLTRTGGVFDGPSGRETYYNLPMKLVVKYMRRLGYSEEEYPYWIREDGCKMLGPYIMVAANLKIRPKGTILETSLGTAIVCDTGGFVKKYPKGIDIAVDW